MENIRERLQKSFSEGGAQEIYRDIKSEGDFLGFARRYAFDDDFRVARSALWGLTKASDTELSALQVILNDFIDQAIQTENPSVRRLSLNIIERRLLFRPHDAPRRVFRHPVALHETRFPNEPVLSRTVRRVHAHARSNGNRLLQTSRERVATENSQWKILVSAQKTSKIGSKICQFEPIFVSL